jgi:photosystem II stability/assembly factor-like uncharacterized protein
MPRFVLCIAALLLCAPVTAFAASPSASPLDALQFRSVGPRVSGGRLGAVAGTDADSSLYYAGAAGGGVWKTVNAGQSWEPVFDKQDVQSIGAVAIDPSHVNTVWVGTGEGAPRNDVMQGDGVYRSTDGGKSWQHVLNLPNTLISRILIDPRDPATVLVGVLGDPFTASTLRGIYRTTDGGKTWTKALSVDTATGVSDMDATAKAPGVVYAGMWTYRRTGWSSQSGGANGGLFKSSDFGATWQRIQGHGLPDGATGRIGVAIAPSNPQRVYALIESKQGLLWRSDDGGADWKLVSSNTLIDERPFYYTHVFVDPTDQNHVWTLSVHVAVSDDGGATWRVGARGVHGDNHAMWISQDAKRIIEANDGGPSFSFDDGKTWAMPHNLPIAQLYHVGTDRQNPYHICAPLQDNGIWCAPNDDLSGRGANAASWHSMGGGDGTWAVPDAADPGYVWLSSGGGNFAGEIDVIDTRTNVTRVVSPYLRDQNVVDPKNLKYRFNWETPIAFDPFDPHIAYTAGNVVFRTSDRGDRWSAISGDLTRNDKTHQIITGGITLDGTGAETSDTILYIEPSRLRRGELWIGTDDGYLQLTLDGGKNWRNVTPPGIKPWGRFASLSASVRDAGTLYAVYDLHMIGDDTPHIYVTRDYGAHWRDVAGTLPGNQQARCVREDPKDPNVVYAGLERSLWMSYDRGAHWEDLSLNLPATSIRDIQVQPESGDLIVATHGRGVYVLDDAAPLRRVAEMTLRRDPANAIFSVRPVYEWNLHSYTATAVDGAAPPIGAIVTYHLMREQKNVTAEVLDSGGRVVRHFSAKDLTGRVGLNRFTWDLTEDKPVDWNFTPQWNRGFLGAPVLPGTYTIAVHAGSTILRAAVAVKQDPRTHYSHAQLRVNQRAQEALLSDFSRVDEALNMLSTVMNEAPLRARTLGKGDSALSVRIDQAAAQAKALLLSITENPLNDQDNDFLTDVLRERLQTQIETFGSFAPPTSTQLQENAALHALTQDRLSAVSAFQAHMLSAIDAALNAAQLPPLERLTKQPPIYSPGAPAEDR